MTILRDMPILLLDCQATASGENGCPIELGWTITTANNEHVSALDCSSVLIRLPSHITLPRQVSRITGITAEMLDRAHRPGEAWKTLKDSLSGFESPMPCVIHYARYEQSQLKKMNRGRMPAQLDILCTHALTKRLIPGLPRKGLRAVAGYFGYAADEHRRSEEHLRAGAAVWSGLVGLLEKEGLTSWEDVKELLNQPVRKSVSRKDYPMPRETRLQVPMDPGVYRMCRQDDSVLYVGKARSLKRRVNSYFQKQRGQAEHILEMLSQAHKIDVTPTATQLEAALLESDEIKRLDPPYNRTLRSRKQDPIFVSLDLKHASPSRSSGYPIGPLRRPELMHAISTLAEWLSGDVMPPAGVLFQISEEYEPPEEIYDAAMAEFKTRFTADNREDVLRALWKLGWRLSREAAADSDLADESDPEESEEETEWEWTPEAVTSTLESLCRRGVKQTGRSRWLYRLSHSNLSWKDETGWHSLIIREAAVRERCSHPDCPSPRDLPQLTATPQPITYDETSHDRMRVLWSELRRLLAAAQPVRFQHSPHAPLTEAELSRVMRYY